MNNKDLISFKQGGLIEVFHLLIYFINICNTYFLYFSNLLLIALILCIYIPICLWCNVQYIDFILFTDIFSYNGLYMHYPVSTCWKAAISWDFQSENCKIGHMYNLAWTKNISWICDDPYTFQREENETSSTSFTFFLHHPNVTMSKIYTCRIYVTIKHAEKFCIYLWKLHPLIINDKFVATWVSVQDIMAVQSAYYKVIITNYLQFFHFTVCFHFF